MALSAVDTIHRGLVNLRANWELIPVQFLQVLIGTVLLLAGFVPPLAVLGFANLDLIDSHSDDWVAMMDSAASLLARGREAWVLMLASVLLSSVIWLMAMLVHCYFQAGIYGVLMAGDRQAPAGRPRGRSWFRTFSVRDLRGWGARHLWRYFWLLNLFLVITTVWLLLPLLLVLLGVWSETQWGPTAAIGIGCGGALLLAFSLFVLAFWFSLAQADLAQEESSVRRAMRQGLLVLSRRLGAVIVVAIVGMIISFTFSMAVVVVTFLGQFGLGSSFAIQLAWQVMLNLIQWVLGCVVGVAFIAVMVALVRSEGPQGAAA